MITIQTQIEVSTAVLGDVAITAAEGGIGYWSRIEGGYDYTRWQPDSQYNAYIEGKADSANIEVPDDFVFYTIEYENPVKFEPPMLSADITPLLLAEGLGMLMRTQHVPDIEGMDSIAADMVVQYGVFGELVFS